MNISRALLEARTACGITQVSAAKKIGITQSFLAQLERGDKEPSTQTLKKCAKAYGLPLEVMLFLGSETKDVAPRKREAYKLLAPLMNNLISELVTGSKT